MPIHRLEQLRAVITHQQKSLARHHHMNTALSPTQPLSQPASKVTLNQTGQRFFIDSHNDIDNEKVDSIKRAINSDTFVIDPQAIAQRMVADIFELP